MVGLSLGLAAQSVWMLLEEKQLPYKVGGPASRARAAGRAGWVMTGVVVVVCSSFR